MADGTNAGAITFSTALDNSDLEKGLEDAQDKVEKLKEKLEKSETERNAIEEKMAKAQEAIEGTKDKLEILNEQMERIFSDTDTTDVAALEKANLEIEAIKSLIDECTTSLENQEGEYSKLNESWTKLNEACQSYSSQLQSAESELDELAQVVSSTYYQASVRVRESFNSMSTSAKNFANRVASLAQSTLVFSVLTQALNTMKKGIADALMQNTQFSASWTYLGATVQGFANGIANVVAPALVAVVNGVTSCIVTLARAIDAVFKTGLASAISAARKTAEESWRQTDASKAAAKQAEQNAQNRAKQEQQYAKAQEQYRKQQDASAKRLADAQEKAAKRQAEAEGRYPAAVEDAAKRQAEAEEKMQERLADAEESAAKRQSKAEEKAQQRKTKAEESAQKRYEKAVESAEKRQASAEQSNAERQASAEERLAKAQQKASERLAKAEATAAQRTADAQAAYEKKVQQAEQKEAAAKAKWDEKQAKAAAKLEKAQKKANETVLGFDELNKMNAEASEDATESVGEYTSTLQEIEPPKTYTVDPSDYYVDPSDYAAKLKEIDYSDYYVDPEDYAIDPSDYVIDPSDYAIDYDDYVIDPEDFFVDPDDYTFDPMDYWVDPDDYAVDAFSFDWQDFGGEVDATAAMNPSWDSLDVGKISAEMVELEAILAGLLLAVGAILAFSGVNIPLGLACMAAGALLYASIIGENWDALPAEVQNAITNALVITGIVLIVLGAIIAFSGASFPIGIGMMVAGAMLEWGAIALNWESLSPEMQQAVTSLMGVLGMAFLVLGAIIAFADPDPTHKAIGVALMVAGAADLAAVVALNWESLTPEMQQALTTMLLLVGTFAIVIGVVLLLAVPGQQALGIGLILTGVALLGTAVALNWNTMKETLIPVLEKILVAVGTFCVVVGIIIALAVPGMQALGIGLIIGGAAMLGSAIALDWAFMDGQLSSVFSGLLKMMGPFLFVLGVILCLANPVSCPLGIALMVAGAAAVGTALALDWNSMDTQLQQTLTAIMVGFGAFALVFGAVLTFSGANIPLGIGLMATGAISLGSAAALNWEWVSTHIDETISIIETALFAAAIVVGAILTFSAVQAPLGLALMALGAMGMAAEAQENWDKLPDDIKNTIAIITAATSVAFLALGAILCFTAVNIPLGVGLIVIGAMELVTLATIDWNKMPEDIKTTITTILATVSVALLVLGIMLCCTGVAIPLGIALIAAGAIGLVTAAAINWDFIVEKVKEIWESIKKFFNDNIAKIFTAEWWFNLFKSIVNGLIDAINNGLNFFGGFVNSISDGIGGILSNFGVEDWSFRIEMPQIPHLARGAVIPPNRKFMAVLGDQTSGNNIETPESLMRQVVREEAGSVFAEMMMTMQGLGGNGGDVTLILNVDSEEMSRAVDRGSAARARRGEIKPELSFV